MKRFAQFALVTLGCLAFVPACFESDDGHDDDSDERGDGGDTFVTVEVNECLDGKTRSCGTELGECSKGEQTCESGYWSACSGTDPDTEVCDGLDNDCDGDVDETFSVRGRCDLPLGCIGRYACSEDGKRTNCVVDPDALSEEICDGLDNDCDGYSDYISRPSGLVSVCECAAERLTFGTTPNNASLKDENGKAPANAFCEETSCSGPPGQLAMSFCMKCAAQPYAMCVSETPKNLASFDDPDAVLTVRFRFESETEAKMAVNLYHTVTFAGHTAAQRRYFSLLVPGDLPGEYVRRFTPEHACFASGSTSGIACRGERDDDCAGCRAMDSCGAAVGDECVAGSVEASELQLAVDAVPCTDTFQGTIRILELYFGPPACEQGPSL